MKHRPRRYLTARLSRYQRKVIKELMDDGFSSEEIAKKVAFPKTVVRRHMKNIREDREKWKRIAKRKSK